MQQLYAEYIAWVGAAKIRIEMWRFLGRVTSGISGRAFSNISPLHNDAFRVLPKPYQLSTGLI